jgi:hypothetical protein
MRRHAVKLALTASLIFAGAAYGLEQDPITTGSISPKSSFSELDPVQAQDDSDDLNQLLAALQEPRAKMYAMAQHDKSMMPGIKRPDQMITMVKKHKAAPKRRAR